MSESACALAWLGGRRKGRACGSCRFCAFWSCWGGVNKALHLVGVEQGCIAKAWGFFGLNGSGLPLAFLSFLSSISSVSHTFFTSMCMYAPASIVGVSTAGHTDIGQSACWIVIGCCRILRQMCSAKCGVMGEASSAATPIQYRTRSACIPMSAVTS